MIQRQRPVWKEPQFAPTMVISAVLALVIVIGFLLFASDNRSVGKAHGFPLKSAASATGKKGKSEGTLNYAPSTCLTVDACPYNSVGAIDVTVSVQPQAR